MEKRLVPLLTIDFCRLPARHCLVITALRTMFIAYALHVDGPEFDQEVECGPPGLKSFRLGKRRSSDWAFLWRSEWHQSWSNIQTKP